MFDPVSIKLNRRRMSGLLFAGTLLAGTRVSATALGATSSSDWPVDWASNIADALVDRLARIALGTPASKLELLRLERVPVDPDVGLRAVVQLTWPPGLRRRPFEVVADRPDRAVALLGDQIESYVNKTIR